MKHRVAFALLAALSSGAAAEEYRTPRAGEAFTATLLGMEIGAPARDRRKITYLNAGGVVLAEAPEEKGFSPQGGLYAFRAPEDGSSRLRAIVAVISNEVRWDRAIRGDRGLSLALTFDSLTLPWPRSEYVDGVRQASGELESHSARAGIGVAWRRSISPGACDNVLDAALTFEPGYLWFRSGSDTAPDYVLPSNTFEGRLHLRLRGDAMTRNVVELPHEGWSAGADVVGGWRATWKPWGLPEAGLSAGGRGWLLASVYGWVAFAPAPGLSERHRGIASAHAGLGADLDRFSAFRLGSGSSWGDFETLSRIVLPGAGVDELFTSRYAILDLEYRYEALFFLYLQLRGTLAWAGRESPSAASGPLPAVTAGLTSGLPWSFSLEASVSRNFGLARTVEGEVRKGSTSFLFSLTREF